MSERCLDRKSVQEVVLPLVEATCTTEESDEASAAAESFPFAEAAEEQQRQPALPPPISGLKWEQRGREALWDLFQSECAFLYDHLMVLKNVRS